MRSPVTRETLERQGRYRRSIALGIAVLAALVIWFVTSPRLALVSTGRLRVTTENGALSTLNSIGEYVVVGCVEEKTQVFPRVETSDGSAWVVVEGPYYLRKGPLWQMGLKFIRIPMGC